MSGNGNADQVEPKKTLTFGKVYKTTCGVSGGTHISVMLNGDTEDEATGVTKEAAAKAPNTIGNMEYVTPEEYLAQLQNGDERAIAHHLSGQNCRSFYGEAPYVCNAATNNSSNSERKED